MNVEAIKREILRLNDLSQGDYQTLSDVEHDCSAEVFYAQRRTPDGDDSFEVQIMVCDYGHEQLGGRYLIRMENMETAAVVATNLAQSIPAALNDNHCWKDIADPARGK